MAAWLGLLLFVTPILAKQCGSSDKAPDPRNFRIVKGAEAEKGAWPWIVWIDDKDTDDLTCAGTIIDKRWIITAAHCFPHRSRVSRNNADLRIVAGDFETFTADDNDPNNPGALLAAEIVIKFPDFDGTADAFGDLALIKTTEDISFNARVKPICLPDQGQVFDEMEPVCYTAGWGDTKRTAKNSYRMQQLHSQIVPRRACQDQYYGAVKDDQICFGDGEGSACVGDNGAPLMCKKRGSWFVAGVMSFTTHTCQGKPSVYTAIGDHAEWIRRQITDYA